jgi:choline dehydrogenase-like flavoprotein/nucleoside-diphosphate-sugar epimerase
MAIVDLAGLGEDLPSQLVECDICIIGSGPAGASIVRELATTGLRITVLESGGSARLPDADLLNMVEDVGRPRQADQWAVRNRILGGSSHTWGGRCAPFDEIDLQDRPWVPASGWPIPLETIAPYLDRSAAHLGLAMGAGFNGSHFWTIAGRPVPPLPDPDLLLPIVWQFSRDPDESYPFEYMRFGRHIERWGGADTLVVTGATALGIHTVESGKAVAAVEYAGFDGRRRMLKAPAVVLCAGGIENARLLLASDSRSPTGLGNDHDMVGRYLMDHLRGPAASFAVGGSEALQRYFGRFNIRKHLFRVGMRLSPEVQRREELLNCAAWLGEVLSERDPWDALRRTFSGKPRLPEDIRLIAANAGMLGRGLKQYFVDRNGVPRALDALELVAMCEQRPDPDSRVTLSDQRDRLGQRLPRTDWRVHDDESRTMRRMAELVAAECARLGFGSPVLADWVRDRAAMPLSFVDVAHPTGTTRMSGDPAQGVVDRNCQVHGVEGLYVAGSSVFPTASHCNPTQMIVALALRAADCIKERAQRPTALPLSGALRHRSGARILVTGATGRIGRTVVADLVERGYRVRATTSRTPPETTGDAIEWRVVDLATATDYDAIVAGCDAVIHLAAELGRKEVMRQVNVEATRLLAAAAERAQIKGFCYVSTVSVYGSGLARDITEASPVLTPDRDIASEYWALDYVREYGRTKLAGEMAIREIAASVPYVILRPTVVVNPGQLVGIRDWGRVKRYLAAHRHAHHIYDRDVSDAAIWAIERGPAGRLPAGSVETFNLSEDDFAEPTHADFMRKAFAVTGDERFRFVKVPGFGDWLHDALRFRSLPLRNPLWRMRFPNTKIKAAGWSPRFGMAKAYERAFEILRREGASAVGAGTVTDPVGTDGPLTTAQS